MDIGRESLAKNYMNANRWWHNYNYSKLGKPVDRDEWDMTPQTYNAYYNPSNNEIVLPAGIFTVPGYRDEELDDAVVYGYGGASTIGHEITHSFDSTGALFDEAGKLDNWWQPADLARFNAAGDALVAQYDAYKAFPDLNLKGRLTLGENIADVAGLATAYDAWKASLGGKPAPVLDGFTGDQRFFLGWAQNYRSKYREKSLRNRVLTDVHSPGPWRAATVRNLDAWYPAFDVKPGQALYLAPDKRVKVW